MKANNMSKKQMDENAIKTGAIKSDTTLHEDSNHMPNNNINTKMDTKNDIKMNSLVELYKMYLPVQWHTGMLMLPQHFQQQELFRQFQLKQLMNILQPYYYGVIDLQYSFTNNVVTISKLLAIMPNLLPVCIMEESECLSLDLSTLDLTLGLSANIASNIAANMASNMASNIGPNGGSNGSAFNNNPSNTNVHDIAQDNMQSSVAHSQALKYKLFLSMPEYGLLEQSMQSPELISWVPDEYDHENKEMIVKLKPNLRLIVDKAPPAKHYSIALFEFSLINNQYVFADYEPTFISWTSENSILPQLEAIKNTLRNKLRFLKIQDELSSSNLHFVKQALTKGLLPFEEQLNAKTHPYQIFQTLIGLIGSLASLTDQPVPSFAYNHDDQTASFKPCIDYINAVLNGLKEEYDRTEFVKEDAVWKVPMNKLSVNQIDGKQCVICSIQMMENTELLDDWLRSCVIATSSVYDQALKNRVLGASRDIMEFVEILHAKSTKNNLFIRIDIDDRFVKLQDDFLLFYNDKPVKETPVQIFGYKM